ncbi:MAG: hypothetical protein M0Z30_12965 [Actinomycetota bacterium]|nr:hypothetical protein [Actinomycetota bacterium]
MANIIHTTLAATALAHARSGPSQARYVLDSSRADAGRHRCAELLSRFPLYPQIQL